MGLTVIGKVPRIKFHYLNNEDIVKFDEQFNKFYDRDNISKYKIKPQVSVYAKSDTCTWYSSEIVLKDKYGLWNESHFLSLDGCSNNFDQASKYVEELEKYVKFKMIDQQVEELLNENK